MKTNRKKLVSPLTFTGKNCKKLTIPPAKFTGIDGKKQPQYLQNSSRQYNQSIQIGVTKDRLTHTLLQRSNLQ
jgi:hypothetical protein